MSADTGPRDLGIGHERGRGGGAAAPYQARVVCPVDSVQVAAVTLGTAVAVAKFCDADLHLLYVARRRAASDDAVLSGLRDLVDALHNAGVALRIATAEGTAKTAVDAYARTQGAAMVVISASYGISPRWRHGSVVRHLGQSMPCPVLVVPRARRGAQTPGREAFVEVVCAIDFRAASEAVLRAALFFSRRSQGRLTLLHVVEGFPSETLIFGMRAARIVERSRAKIASEGERLRRLVPMRALGGSRLESIVALGDAHRGILQAASDAMADLIVMGMVPRRLLKDVLVGSTSRVVLRRATCPVLLVPVLWT